MRGPNPPSCPSGETACGGREVKGCGKFKKKGKELPFPFFPSFSFYVFVYSFTWTNISFLLDKEIGEAALFYSRPKGNASFLPGDESWQRGLGLWYLRGIRALRPVRAEGGFVIGLE